jgi:hypothetical protein
MIKLEFQVLNFTRRHKTYLRFEYLYDKAKKLWEHLNTHYYVTSEASNFMLYIHGRQNLIIYICYRFI